MASFNRTILLGNLTRDPEVRYIPSGAAVCEISIAVNEKWKDKEGNQKESVAFIDCTAWGRTAEVIGQYLSKGSSILVEGKLTQDTWQDKESGKTRSKLKVTVEKMTMVGSKSGGGSQEPSNSDYGHEPHGGGHDDGFPGPDDGGF